jgi:hypothetical protein
MIIMLLLWIAPALVLAPLLAWAVLKRGGNPLLDAELLGAQIAKLEDSVQAEAQQQPEKNREREQPEQTPACEPATINFAEKCHAIV